MMRKILTNMFLLIYLSSACVAIAQESTPESVILVTSNDCLLLERHVPNADVSYKPNVDVRGKPVVPADLAGSNPLEIGKNGYSFYLTHDALKEKSGPNGYGLSQTDEGKIILGQVTVIDNDVLWNGTSLKEMDKQRIYMLCDEQKREKRRPIRKR